MSRGAPFWEAVPSLDVRRSQLLRYRFDARPTIGQKSAELNVLPARRHRLRAHHSEGSGRDEHHPRELLEGRTLAEENRPDQ